MKLNTNMRVTRISEEVWEIAPTEKEGMLVPARIYATPTILQTMDAGVDGMRPVCRMAIGAMVFPSEASPHLTSGQGSFRLGASTMTSIVACVSSEQISPGKMYSHDLID
jgi:hypothetical protein